jgi:hypothetical protein
MPALFTQPRFSASQGLPRLVHPVPVRIGLGKTLGALRQFVVLNGDLLHRADLVAGAHALDDRSGFVGTIAPVFGASVVRELTDPQMSGREATPAASGAKARRRCSPGCRLPPYFTFEKADYRTQTYIRIHAWRCPHCGLSGALRCLYCTRRGPCIATATYPNASAPLLAAS